LREGYFGATVVIKTLLNAGFKGKIFPVNPLYQKVLGLKVYPSLKDISEKLDLVFLIINRRSVPDMMRACADKGIRPSSSSQMDLRKEMRRVRDCNKRL
jgi:acetyltransferase